MDDLPALIVGPDREPVTFVVDPFPVLDAVVEPHAWTQWRGWAERARELAFTPDIEAMGSDEAAVFLQQLHDQIFDRVFEVFLMSRLQVWLGD